jgi:hypothetical protein
MISPGVSVLAWPFLDLGLLISVDLGSLDIQLKFGSDLLQLKLLAIFLQIALVIQNRTSVLSVHQPNQLIFPFHVSGADFLDLLQTV